MFEMCSLHVQDKAEAKLQMLEKKAQEQQKARLAADEEWRHQQRERELARLKVGFPPKRHSMHVCQSDTSLPDCVSCRPLSSQPILLCPISLHSTGSHHNPPHQVEPGCTAQVTSRLQIEKGNVIFHTCLPYSLVWDKAKL